MRASRLYALLARHWWLALLLMGASFVLFGLISLNLVQVLSANLRFLAENGLEAARDGGLIQLFELLVSGYLAVAFFVVFKLCEKVLVDRLSHGGNKEEQT